MKKCTKCNKNKLLTEFNKKSKSPDGYRTQCRLCTKRYNQTRKNKIIYKNIRKKRCLQCKKNRNINFFHKCPHNKDGYNSWCLTCTSIYKKDYYKTNSNKINQYVKNKLLKNPKLKMLKNYRTRLGQAFKNLNKSKSTIKLLGCSVREFQDHIIGQFTHGMSIYNYGEWHIDHIVPLSSAKSKRELEKLCHFTNLQPLWAIDNLRKSDKW